MLSQPDKQNPANLIRIVQRFLLGVDLGFDGTVTLAPVVPPEFWARGFGQTLVWRKRTLDYRMQRNEIAGAYTGGAPQRLAVRFAPDRRAATSVQAKVNGAASEPQRIGDLIFLALPAAPTGRPTRFEIRAGLAGSEAHGAPGEPRLVASRC